MVMIKAKFPKLATSFFSRCYAVYIYFIILFSYIVRHYLLILLDFVSLSSYYDI